MKSGKGRILDPIQGCIEQDIVRDLERWTPTGGAPQGAVISPLLANLRLHPLDCRMRSRGFRMVRYADDFVVLCKSPADAQAALAEIRSRVSANGLAPHPDKTHVGDCRVEGQGFEFLGCRFEAGKRWVRKKSLKALRDRVRARTKRTRGDSLEDIIKSPNPMLRGWFEYFKHAAPYVHKMVDGFIRRRLRAVLRQQMHRPGFGRCLNDHKRWPNAFFAAQGLFTMMEARALASQSRC